MPRPKHIAEYLLLRTVAIIANLLPYAAARKLGSGYAPIGFGLFRSLRAEAERRIRQVFGDQLSDSEVARIAAASYRDLVWHTIEILRTPKLTPQWMEKYGVVEEEDRLRLEQAMGLNKGVIIAAAHLANWDLAGVGIQRMGYPMTFLVRKQKNPLFDRYLNRMRSYLGSEVIERDDPMLVRKVVRSLKKGNVVAIAVDLRARQPDLKLPFLGHIADLGRGPGLISHISGCPVVPAYVTRLPGGRHRWHFKEAIMPDAQLNRNEDAERIVRESLKPLEAAVREHPDQYFWFNKRWVLEPIES